MILRIRRKPARGRDPSVMVEEERGLLEEEHTALDLNIADILHRTQTPGFDDYTYDEVILRNRHGWETVFRRFDGD